MMKCQKCNINNASVLIRQVINGKEFEYRLCDTCAAEIGLTKQSNFSPEFYAGGGFFSPAFFSGFAPFSEESSEHKQGAFVTNKINSLTCSNCGSTLAEINKTGKLGCSHCYETYGEQLVQIFRRIQSGETHRGRIMAQTAENQTIQRLRSEIKTMQEKIKTAVASEDYMKAAEYKTKIQKATKEIEKNLGNDFQDPSVIQKGAK